MRFWRMVFASLALIFFALPACAEKRIALVIGNDIYRNLPEREQLHNAVNDARAIRAALDGLGFEVMPVAENLDRAALVGRLSDFAARLEQGDIAFFFYAGHGVSLNGANFLLPTDIPPPRASGRAEEDRLAELSVPESSISDRIKRSGAHIAVVVLDACRDNPLAPPGGRSVGVSRGLAPPPENRGVLSIYSAGSGQQALDRLGEADTSANSVFTRVFVKKLRTPGLGLRAAAFETQGEVALLAGGAGHEQVPGVYSQIIGEDVFLSGRDGAGPVAVETAIADAQGADFEAAMQADTVAALGGFAEKYKTGPFVVIARRERERLSKVAILDEGTKEQAAKDAAAEAIRGKATRDAATQAIRDQAARELAAVKAAELKARERQQAALQEADIAQRALDRYLNQHAALPPPAVPSIKKEPVPNPQETSTYFHFVSGLDPNGWNWLALRNSPNASAAWSKTIQIGPETPVTLVGKSGDFSQVKLRSGETGWVTAAHIECCRKAKEPMYHFVSGICLTCSDGWLALRSAPGLTASFPQEPKLKPGALLTVLGKSADFFQVKLRSGESGWVSSKYVKCCR